MPSGVFGEKESEYKPSGLSPAREGCYRFKVATLAFAVNRAEGKRRLARAGHPSDSDEFATGHIDVDVAQVVQVGIADLDSRHVL